MNQRYAQVCVETQAKQAVATMTLTATDDTYTLPSAIDRIIEMYVTPVGGSRSLPLQLTTVEDLIVRKAGTTSTNDQGVYVSHYALLGIDEFVVWPTPQAADVITIYYVTLPTALSADADVPILHEPWVSKVLFHGAAQDAAEFQGDWQNAQWHAAQFEAWLGRYRTHLNRKRGQSTQQLRISSDRLKPPHDPSTDTFYRA